MEALIVRAFRFFKRLIWLLAALMMLLVYLDTGPLKGTNGWVQSATLAAISILLVIVGTVWIVTAVERRQGVAASSRQARKN